MSISRKETDMFESRIETIKKVVFPDDDRKEVLFEFEGGSCWQGAKLKDFYRLEDERKWKDLIKTGTKIRMWTIQYSIVLGIELLDNTAIWCKANNFETHKEEKKSSESYTNFILKEGNKIANLIDKGKSLGEIDKLISDQHSGNTHAWALRIGISKAKNKANANKVRVEHNKYWGILENHKGIVNPAVLTIKTKGD